jgi:mercuric ion transport protein
MKIAVVGSSSVLAAFLASFCCIGPLVLSGIGIGSVTFATVLEPWRPYLIGLTAIFLGVGFYFAYRPQKIECKPGEIREPPVKRTTQRVLLWVVTAIAAMLAAFPYILPYLP